jgi:hypothetical protein
MEAATPLAGRLNLRGGFNLFGYDRTFHKDGVTYAGQLQFRSAEAHVDWFPFGRSFHVSPGALIYNGNQVSANASVAGGQSFTLNSTSYLSDPADPVTGNGKISFAKGGPMLTVGFGNLVPRLTASAFHLKSARSTLARPLSHSIFLAVPAIRPGRTAAASRQPRLFRAMCRLRRTKSTTICRSSSSIRSFRSGSA